jgi:hypothetical protein
MSRTGDRAGTLQLAWFDVLPAMLEPGGTIADRRRGGLTAGTGSHGGDAPRPTRNSLRR